MSKWITYGLALACTALALLVPWTYYGDTGFGVTRFPGWPIYLVGALVLHACSWWPSVAGRVSAAAGGAVALVTAFVLMLGYDDAGALFDGPVILVVPVMGWGGFLAVAGVLVNLVLVGFRKMPARREFAAN
ncbi:hypothetical protein JNUCC0626_41205 [Lentzea sp. JNUCC 0626]|uniref:hypothetical protein n=1 Tax=Lentzea sp. JNUCC 0626 TaxID=3367513 RepID=UPI00374949CE